jgi:hypothetical protein
MAKALGGAKCSDGQKMVRDAYGHKRDDLHQAQD